MAGVFGVVSAARYAASLVCVVLVLVLVLVLGAGVGLGATTLQMRPAVTTPPTEYRAVFSTRWRSMTFVPSTPRRINV